MTGARRSDRGRGGASYRLRIAALTTIAVLTAAAFGVTLQVSMAGAFRGERPLLALSWAPFDAQARARLAARLVTLEQSPEAQKIAVDLAHDAIRRDPLMPVAFWTLATARTGTAGADPNSALVLLTQAERLSRRDQPTQIWFIEHNVRLGRPEAVMAHFDIALRTSASAQQALFPLVASLLTDPDLFSELRRRLRQEPEWASPFLNYLVYREYDPVRTAQLTLEFLDPADPEERELIVGLMQRLATLGEYELTWDIYTSAGLARRGGQPGMLVNGGFEDAAGVAPFAWTFVEDGDLWARLQGAPGGKGSALEVMASSGRSGEVARQLVRLAPGNYRLNADVGNIPEAAFDRPEVRITCAAKGAETALLAIRPRAAGTERQSITGSFAVPANCSFQWLSIAVAGDQLQAEAGPWLDNVRLTRVSS